MKKRILYIDGWNLLISQNAVANILDQNSQQIGMYLTSMNLLRNFIDKLKPSKVIFVLDGPNAGERRRKIFPDYKNKRKVEGRQSKVTIMEGDENMVYGSEGAFQNQLIQIFNFLKLLPITVLIIPYNEADDVIAYLTLKNKEEFDNIIVSNDRDYLQLIQSGISVYRFKTKLLYDEERFLEEFKILPSNYIYKKILLGDASDAISGLKGIGEKTFEVFHKYLCLKENDFGNDVNKFMNFLKIMNLEGCNTRQKNAITKILNDESFAKINLSYFLMKLNEECMLQEQIEILKLQIEEQKNKKISKLTLKQKMRKTGFGKLFKDFNDELFLRPFVFLPQGIEIKD